MLRWIPNFKNVLHSLSEKHKLTQALNSTEDILYKDCDISDECVT